MLCLGSEKTERKEGRRRKGAHSVAGQQGWELLLWSGSDRRSKMTQGLDSPCLHLSTIHLRLFVCAPSHLCILKQHSRGSGSAVLPSARQWWRISSIRQCKQCISTVKLKGTRDKGSMVYSNKTHLRKSYYTVEYDNSYTLCWSSELVRVVYSQMSA